MKYYVGLKEHLIDKKNQSIEKKRKYNIWTMNMRAALVAISIFQLIQGYSDTVAIIGGSDNALSDPYAAVISSSGIATRISGSGAPIGSGSIRSVAINASGVGLVGGSDDSDSYAAIISPSGVATKISGTPLSALIFSVAINDSGLGVVGGVQSSGFYAAIISPTGVATPISGAALPTNQARIFTVAINKSGAGIIGGDQNNNNDPYAAFISSSGATSPISGIPLDSGSIISVSINDSGSAIMGGDIPIGSPYAAIISSSGVATSISGAGVPVDGGNIKSVMINNSGSGIIGGIDNSFLSPYAAVISKDGVATKISGAGVPIDDGQINSVAINESGTGIIGGKEMTNVPYAAFISPLGIATKISAAGLTSGEIQSVAIDDSGAAIIGGRNAGAAYAALISPSGIATEISGAGIPTGNGQINSVAILLQAVVPKSYGPGSSYANSLFSLSSQALSNHLTALKIPPTTNQYLKNKEIGLVADASEMLQKKKSALTTQSSSQKLFDRGKYSIWLAPFGDYAHQEQYGNISSIDNWISGVVGGFDFYGVQNLVLGIGGAYAFNYAHLSQGAGHACTNQEFLTVYGSWTAKNFFIDFALWGGIYQMKNVRHSIAGITSKSNLDGWLFDPHIEISTPFSAKGDWLTIDPFAMFDWANNWQGDVQEKGASGFNLIIDSQYTSLLRSEVGLRIFESFQYEWGNFLLQEKVSWVNKLPFNSKATQAAFVASVSSFSVELFSNQTQNLGAVQLNACFFPGKKKYPYGSINYQGEFGSSFQNHLLSLEIGKEF
jgi:hypothetical protein